MIAMSSAGSAEIDLAMGEANRWEWQTHVFMYPQNGRSGARSISGACHNRQLSFRGR